MSLDAGMKQTSFERFTEVKITGNDEHLQGLFFGHRYLSPWLRAAASVLGRRTKIGTDPPS